MTTKPKLILTVLPQIMAEIGFVEKGRKNQMQGYLFRGIDDLYPVLQPLLAKYKVTLTARTLTERREERTTGKGGLLLYSIVLVEYTLTAEDDSSVSSSFVGEAMDSGDKATNKAYSAALKLFIIQTFQIPTEGDNDTENHSPSPAPKKTPQERAFGEKKTGKTDTLEADVNKLKSTMTKWAWKSSEISALISKKFMKEKFDQLTEVQRAELISAVGMQGPALALK
jgi:transcription termination factor NusB